MNFTRNELQKAINNALSMADVLRNLSLPEGGGYRRKLKKMIETHGLDISHLNGRKATSKKNSVWQKIRKSCPVCGNCFETQLGHHMLNNPKRSKESDFKFSLNGIEYSRQESFNY